MLKPGYYSFVLAQVIGAFAFILAVVVMGRMYYYRKMILAMQDTNPLIPIVAMLNLFIGIVLVLTHTYWGVTGAFTMTVISWTILIHAVLWLALPEKMLTILKKICSGGGYYWLIVFLLIFGVILLSRSLQLFIVTRAALGALT